MSREKRMVHAIFTGKKDTEDKLYRLPGSGTRYIVQKDTGSVINPDRVKLTKSQKRQLKKLRTQDRVAAQAALATCNQTASTK